MVGIQDTFGCSSGQLPEVLEYHGLIKSAIASSQGDGGHMGVRGQRAAAGTCARQVTECACGLGHEMCDAGTADVRA